MKDDETLIVGSSGPKKPRAQQQQKQIYIYTHKNDVQSRITIGNTKREVCESKNFAQKGNDHKHLETLSRVRSFTNDFYRTATKSEHRIQQSTHSATSKSMGLTTETNNDGTCCTNHGPNRYSSRFSGWQSVYASFHATEGADESR